MLLRNIKIYIHNLKNFERKLGENNRKYQCLGWNSVAQAQVLVYELYNLEQCGQGQAKNYQAAKHAV